MKFVFGIISAILVMALSQSAFAQLAPPQDEFEAITKQIEDGKDLYLIGPTVPYRVREKKLSPEQGVQLIRQLLAHPAVDDNSLSNVALYLATHNNFVIRDSIRYFNEYKSKDDKRTLVQMVNDRGYVREFDQILYDLTKHKKAGHDTFIKISAHVAEALRYKWHHDDDRLLYLIIIVEAVFKQSHRSGEGALLFALRGLDSVTLEGPEMLEVLDKIMTLPGITGWLLSEIARVVVKYDEKPRARLEKIMGLPNGDPRSFEGIGQALALTRKPVDGAKDLIEKMISYPGLVESPHGSSMLAGVGYAFQNPKNTFADGTPLILRALHVYRQWAAQMKNSTDVSSKDNLRNNTALMVAMQTVLKSGPKLDALSILDVICSEPSISSYQSGMLHRVLGQLEAAKIISKDQRESFEKKLPPPG
jgi:hypothetical protein